MNWGEASKVLNLNAKHSAEERKKAYRELVKKYHPDLNPSKAAEQLMARINEAYEYLNNHEPEASKALTHLGIFTITNV